MAGFLARVFRRRARTLDALEGPTRVDLECRVASPDVVVSPVSGTTAAMVRWTLLEQRSSGGGSQGSRSETSYRVLDRGLYGEPVLLLAFAGEAIEVPLERARLALVEDEADGTFLSAVPDALRASVARLATDRAIAYREAYLLQGSVVRLVATVERLPERRPGYRERAGFRADLRAQIDERITLRELGYG